MASRSSISIGRSVADGCVPLPVAAWTSKAGMDVTEVTCATASVVVGEVTIGALPTGASPSAIGTVVVTGGGTTSSIGKSGIVTSGNVVTGMVVGPGIVGTGMVVGIEMVVVTGSSGSPSTTSSTRLPKPWAGRASANRVKDKMLRSWRVRWWPVDIPSISSKLTVVPKEIEVSSRCHFGDIPGGLDPSKTSCWHSLCSWLLVARRCSLRPTRRNGSRLTCRCWATSKPQPLTPPPIERPWLSRLPRSTTQ